MEFAEEIRDFLIESNENLANLDQEIVELEKNPKDEKLIASVFRTIHTIKGTSGFFGFKILGSITHVAENILGQVREKQRDLTPELVSLVLETVDAVRAVLVHVEAKGVEGEDLYGALRKRLEQAFQNLPPSGAAIGGKGAERRKERRNPERVAADHAEAARMQSARVELEHHLVIDQERFAHPQALTAPDLRGESVTSPAHGKKPPATDASATHERRGDGETPRRRTDDHNSSNSTIRVEVSLLDKLMNLVGELVLARNQILQGANEWAGTNATAQRLNLITSELQEGVMRTRMQPIGVVWNKLPRVVRDLASEMGKKIEIVMEGAETELDKTIIEAIKDPLTHIVRNSCDHGIETAELRIAKGKKPEGTILLRAFHEGGHVNIEISDDGAGFDTERMKSKAVEKGILRSEQAAQMTEWEALRLIFHPGFSTAEKVTSISGRGVGMDVVKTNIEKISGTVDLANRAGAGTTIKIKIPLTLAIIPGLIVSVRGSQRSTSSGPAKETADRRCRDHRFVIPQANLLELVRLEGTKDRQQIEKIHGVEVYRRRGKLLPLAYLSEVLGLPSVREPEDVMNIVVVKAEDTAFGLVVDEVNDTQEIVVKALGKQLKALSCYLGATIMGDGRIALILDVTGVARLANMLAQPLERTRSGSMVDGRVSETRQMLLLFRTGRFPRLVLPLALVARLEEVAAARIEYAGGFPVVRYRDAILPLVPLSRILDPTSSAPELRAESLQVIVLSQSCRYVGMVVEEILDIVDDDVTIKQTTSARGLLGSGVVGGKVTDFVDLEALWGEAQVALEEDQTAPQEVGLRLMLVDQRKMPRGILRGYLEMHQYRVLEFDDLEHATKVLQQTDSAAMSSVLLFSFDCGAGSKQYDMTCELLRILREEAGVRSLLVIGLVAPESRNRQDDSSELNKLLDERIDASDRASILACMKRFSRQHSCQSEDAGPSAELVGAGGLR